MYIYILGEYLFQVPINHKYSIKYVIFFFGNQKSIILHKIWLFKQPDIF